MRPSSGGYVVPQRGEKEFNQVAEVGEPSAIDVGPRGVHVGPGHRRRLVVEVALGVVDASAVALPDHVISDEESVYDEEDEFDALRRRTAHRGVLPCFNGVQLAIDITLRGVMSKDGQPHLQAADVDGIVLERARRDKETEYRARGVGALSVGCAGHRNWRQVERAL